MKFGFWFNFIVFLEIKTKLFVTYLLVQLVISFFENYKRYERN